MNEKCESCGRAWDAINTNEKCPFCGFIPAQGGSFNTIKEALSFLVREYGAEIYHNPKRLIAYLSDYAATFTEERYYIKMCAEAGVLAIIIQANDCVSEEKTTALKKSISMMEQKYLMRAESAVMIVEWITSSLHWDNSLFRDINETYNRKVSVVSSQNDNSIRREYRKKETDLEEIDSQQLYKLGYNSYYGYGVAKDYNKAFEFFFEAAKLGNANGLSGLSYCYYYGYGTSQNYYKAYEYASKAAEQGNADGQTVLAYCYYYGYGTSQNYYKAYEYASKAAEQGNADGQTVLAYCYYYGYGTSQNYYKAYEYASKAAEQGNADGQTVLAYCYYYGYGTSQNYYKAYEYASKAAEQGNAYGQNVLAYCYYYGYGIKKNYRLSREYFEASAKGGNQDSKKMLSRL